MKINSHLSTELKILGLQRAMIKTIYTYSCIWLFIFAFKKLIEISKRYIWLHVLNTEGTILVDQI